MAKILLKDFREGRILCLAFYFKILFNKEILDDLKNKDFNELNTFCLGFLKFNLAKFKKLNGKDLTWFRYFLEQEAYKVPKPLFFYFGLYHGAYIVPNCSPKYSLAGEESSRNDNDILKAFNWEYIKEFLGGILNEKSQLKQVKRPDKYLLTQKINFFRKEIVLTIIPKNIFRNLPKDITYEDKIDLVNLNKSVNLFLKFQISKHFLNYEEFFREYHNRLLNFKNKIQEKFPKLEIKFSHAMSYDWFDIATLISIGKTCDLDLNLILKIFKESVILTNKYKGNYPFLKTETDIFIGSEIVNNTQLSELPSLYLRISSRFMEKIGYTSKILEELQNIKLNGKTLIDLYKINLLYGIRDLFLIPRHEVKIKHRLNEFLEMLNNLANLKIEGKTVISDIQIIPHTPYEGEKQKV